MSLADTNLYFILLSKHEQWRFLNMFIFWLTFQQVSQGDTDVALLWVTPPCFHVLTSFKGFIVHVMLQKVLSSMWCYREFVKRVDIL